MPHPLLKAIRKPIQQRQASDEAADGQGCRLCGRPLKGGEQGPRVCDKCMAKLHAAISDDAT